MPEFTRIACGEAPKRKQEEDGYARFTRGQKAVDKAAATPENQAKIAEIRKTDRLIDHPVRFYTYADRLEGTAELACYPISGEERSPSPA